MSNAALSAAHRNIFRRLHSLADTWRDNPDAGFDAEAARRFCDALDVHVDKLITGIALLRQTALAAIRAQKERG